MPLKQYVMKTKLCILILAVFVLSCSSSNEDELITGTGQEQGGSNNNGEQNGSGNGENMASFSGNFVSSAHTTKGQAVVNEEHTNLTLQNFMTDSGPKLEVYLTTDLSAQNFISLGELQGLNGTYTYNLPQSSINFNTYKYVIIWCVDFSVNFGYAQLE